MRLYIGGCHQNKLNLALGDTGIDPSDVRDGAALDGESALTAKLIDHFHLLIGNVLRAGENAEDFARLLCARNPDAVIVSDEIGMGIVPVDSFERAWREDVGRALCIVAAACERVDRVFYGIPTRIK